MNQAQKAPNDQGGGQAERDPHKVFVVHGRNNKANDAMANFLREINLLPIEWEEARAATGKGSPYIGEIIVQGLAMAKAVVVLMTPDDEALLRVPYRKSDDPTYEIQLMGQARPNVIFEAGMALMKYPVETVLVELGELRPISDISGVHTVRLDGNVPKLKVLARRLKDAGCDVDASVADYARLARDFKSAVDDSKPRPRRRQLSDQERQKLTEDDERLASLTRRASRLEGLILQAKNTEEYGAKLKDGRRNVRERVAQLGDYPSVELAAIKLMWFSEKIRLNEYLKLDNAKERRDTARELNSALYDAIKQARDNIDASLKTTAPRSR